VKIGFLSKEHSKNNCPEGLQPIDSMESLADFSGLLVSSQFTHADPLARLRKKIGPWGLIWSESENDTSLSDGYWPGRSAAEAELQQVAKQKSLLKHRDTQEISEQLMAYLFAHPKRILTPQPNDAATGYHHYPYLSQVLGLSHSQSAHLIERLVQHQLIQSAQLNTRVRLCPTCNGSHLNFIDLSPFNDSVNICQKVGLHCFNCGHVDAEDTFLNTTSEGLACPNCQAKLLHIGHDYDRPLETWYCESTQAFFTEPKVKADCMTCHTRTETHALLTQSWHSYQISAKGSLALLEQNPLQLSEPPTKTLKDLRTRLHFSIEQQAQVHLYQIVLKTSQTHSQENLSIFQQIETWLPESYPRWRLTQHQLWLALPNEQQVSNFKSKLSELSEHFPQSQGTLEINHLPPPTDANQLNAWLQQALA
jgi:hypothetical protein